MPGCHNFHMDDRRQSPPPFHRGPRRQLFPPNDDNPTVIEIHDSNDDVLCTIQIPSGLRVASPRRCEQCWFRDILFGSNLGNNGNNHNKRWRSS